MIPGNGDDLVAADNEWPCLALGSRDLGVHEHVLDLLAAPRQTVAGTPPPYLKALAVGRDAPGAPAHLAIEPTGERSSQTWSYSRTTARPPPRSSRVEPSIDSRSSDELRRRRLPLGEAEEVPFGGRVELAQQRQDLLADEPALRVRVGRVPAEVEALGEAIGLGLVAPEVEQGADDAVGALRLDPAGRAADATSR